MTMTLATMLKNLLAKNLKAFPMSMVYVYNAYIERLNTDHKLIFSSRNNLFRDTTDPQVILNTAKSAVLKMSVISAKLEDDYLYIRLDC